MVVQPAVTQPDPGSLAATDRTRLATMSLRISAVFYLLIAGLLALTPFSWDEPGTGTDLLVRGGIAWFLAALGVGLAVFSLVLVRALRRRKRWAWIAAIVLFGLYLPSLFLPLGAVGLFGLLSEGTRIRFDLAQRERLRRRR